MFRSQSRIDDRRQGLEERPASLFVSTSAAMSPARQPDDVRLADEAKLAGWSDPGLEALKKQLEIACRHGAVIERVAANHGWLPSIIAGFCSRRSGWGLDLSPVGTEGTRNFQARPAVTERRCSPLPPDGLGYERGLMALDVDRHLLAREAQWCDPESNIEAAFSLITADRTALRRRTTLQGEGLLRASLTAFECGLELVERAIRLGLDVDSATPGWSCGAWGCGRDVLARAAFFQAEGWD